MKFDNIKKDLILYLFWLFLCHTLIVIMIYFCFVNRIYGIFAFPNEINFHQNAYIRAYIRIIIDVVIVILLGAFSVHKVLLLTSFK